MDVPEGDDQRHLLDKAVLLRRPGARASVWELALPKACGRPLVMQLTQEPHAVGGFVLEVNTDPETWRYGRAGPLRPALQGPADGVFEGAVAGDAMTGEVRARDQRGAWTARHRGAMPR
jgi:hypothetical protein